MDQDQGVFQHALHALGVGDEVRGEITAVKLHALDHFQRRLHGLRFLHGDDAVLADFLHRLGNDVADGEVVVGRNRAYLGDHRALLNLFGEFVEFTLGVLLVAVLAGLIVTANGANRVFDAALHVHRVGAGGHRLGALAEDRLSEDGSGSGAIARHIRSFRGDLTRPCSPGGPAARFPSPPSRRPW